MIKREDNFSVKNIEDIINYEKNKYTLDDFGFTRVIVKTKKIDFNTWNISDIYVDRIDKDNIMLRFYSKDIKKFTSNIILKNNIDYDIYTTVSEDKSSVYFHIDEIEGHTK